MKVLMETTQNLIKNLLKDHPYHFLDIDYELHDKTEKLTFLVVDQEYHYCKLCISIRIQYDYELIEIICKHPNAEDGKKDIVKTGNWRLNMNNGIWTIQHIINELKKEIEV